MVYVGNSFNGLSLVAIAGVAGVSQLKVSKPKWTGYTTEVSGTSDRTSKVMGKAL
jgi:hypothetical protein